MLHQRGQKSAWSGLCRPWPVVFDHYGDVYWPVFEALKRVLDEKRARRRERPNTGLRAMQDRHRFLHIRTLSRALR